MAVLFVEYLEHRQARASTSTSTGASPTCASRSPGPSPGLESGISSVWKETEKVMKGKLGVKQDWQGCQEGQGVKVGGKEDGEKEVGVGVGVKNEGVEKGVEKGVNKDKDKDKRGRQGPAGEMLTMGEEAELLAMELRMAIASKEVTTSTHI